MEKSVEEFYFDNYDLDNGRDNICLKLKELTIEQIYDFLLLNKEKIRFIAAANIPQFSNIDLISSVLRIVNEADDDNIDYEYIGQKLNVSHSQSAKVKYGENHLKLAIQMGLIEKNPYRVTNIGEIYLLMKKSEQEEMNRKLFFRIPIVQLVLTEASHEQINVMKTMEMYLSQKTAVRRRGNVRKIVVEILKELPENRQMLIEQNLIWDQNE